MSAQSRPLEKSRWDGAVDCVGGGVLGRILAETNYGGVVAACGLAGDTDLATTVMPFILRGVRLEGVDSVMISLDRRRRAWQLLAETLNDEDYRRINAGNIALSDIPHAADKVLAGESNGRYLVENRNQLKPPCRKSPPAFSELMFVIQPSGAPVVILSLKTGMPS